jgi:hypothetical protein
MLASGFDRESQPGMSQNPSCWCRNNSLEPFSADYLRCASCETLVVAKMPGPEDLLVRGGSRDLHGRRCFTQVAGEHWLPPLNKCARTHLSKRCIFWLKALLKYRLPPGRILAGPVESQDIAVAAETLYGRPLRRSLCFVL